MFSASQEYVLYINGETINVYLFIKIVKCSSASSFYVPIQNQKKKKNLLNWMWDSLYVRRFQYKSNLHIYIFILHTYNRLYNNNTLTYVYIAIFVLLLCRRHLKYFIWILMRGTYIHILHICTYINTLVYRRGDVSLTIRKEVGDLPVGCAMYNISNHIFFKYHAILSIYIYTTILRDTCNTYLVFIAHLNSNCLSYS